MSTCFCLFKTRRRELGPFLMHERRPSKTCSNIFSKSSEIQEQSLGRARGRALSDGIFRVFGGGLDETDASLAGKNNVKLVTFSLFFYRKTPVSSSLFYHSMSFPL
ncbi:hypothetical protein Naga_100034g41 [Nannochloropsis gaditana]|uniref:Uncharacterized protein n=1 Tax=Nannochloropsis gaditana TaxID=72520 RepID=W7TKX3_9STRA|nr:hypothetical protein Naga_100034g41 [Nannochloropsis gaditana]